MYMYRFVVNVTVTLVPRPSAIPPSTENATITVDDR